MTILGLSFFYHDAAAALLIDGKISGAVQEERFTRIKFDNRFPVLSIAHLLREAKLNIGNIDLVVFYETPWKKAGRIIASYAKNFPRDAKLIPKIFRAQFGKKFWIKSTIRRELGFRGPIKFVDHHQSHAASAFYASPFSRAAFLTADGVGERQTTTYGVADGKGLKVLKEINFPHSLGLLYSAFTYFTGFRVNSGEYKLMGLAPYGEPRYVKTILENLIALRDDGSYRLNMDYFDFETGEGMINDKFRELFGRRERKPESPVTRVDMDLARSIQEVTEEVMLRLAKTIKKETGERYLVMAGGVALNCVANGRLLSSGLFDDIWIQPAAGDAGGALGAALCAWKKPVQFSAFLGPEYSQQEVREYLESNYIPYTESQNIAAETARLLADGKIVGWFQGRMEYGPRALGSRSILGHPGLAEMQKKMNLKIKFRESFRPFAPAVLEERAAEWFEGSRRSPYMMFTFPLREDKRLPVDDAGKFGLEKLNLARSKVPAITHVDFSARIQTVSRTDNPGFYDLIREFHKLTGIPMVVNTSFNVRGEPIVCTPHEAFRCFARTDIDYLVLDNFLVAKEDLPMVAQAIKEEVYAAD